MSLSSTTPAVNLHAVGTSASLTHTRELEAAIQDELRSISQIENVSVEREDGTVFVWVAADNPAQSLRHEIFAKQISLIESYPKVSFDFNLISAK